MYNNTWKASRFLQALLVLLPFLNKQLEYAWHTKAIHINVYNLMNLDVSTVDTGETINTI